MAGTSTVGECCETPIPLDTCGENQKCVVGGTCTGNIIVNSYNDEQVRELLTEKFCPGSTVIIYSYYVL